MNFLLVDDEPQALRQLDLLVGEVNPYAERRCFQNANEALDYAHSRKIDVAFLDIRMNGIDGITLAEALRQLYPKVNIIFCTAYPDYSMKAHELYCSAYLLKPITAKQLHQAMLNLRYPIVEVTSDVTIQCFGSFEVYHEGAPIAFRYRRTKELLAYLVDRNGAYCSTRELEQLLFGDRQRSAYFQSLRRDLLTTFEKLGAPDVIRQAKGLLAVNRKAVQCDYFEYRDGRAIGSPEQYMTQYENLKLV